MPHSVSHSVAVSMDTRDLGMGVMHLSTGWRYIVWRYTEYGVRAIASRIVWSIVEHVESVGVQVEYME